jgi:prophage regulatory protein
MNGSAEKLEKREGLVDRILFRDEVLDMVGLGASTVNKLEREGRFPRRVHVGDRRTGWRLSDLKKWLDGLETVSTYDAPGK